MFKTNISVNKLFKGEKIMKGIWANKEVCELFSSVEQKKAQGIALRNAFEEHAKKYNRKPNSVRNYYYQEIDKLSNDSERLEKLKINLELHKKNKSESFSKIEEQNLVNKIDMLKNQGKSVRSACYELSNGDPTVMLRYQNKYRNFTKAQSGQSAEQNNIIRFTSRKQGLSENDITSLFMGLVRLIRRNIASDLEEKQAKEKEGLNEKLRKAIVMLGEKDSQLLSLKEKFEKLRKENQSLNQKMIKLKCEKANLLSLKKTKVAENV